MYVESTRLKLVIQMIHGANELARIAQQLGVVLIEEEKYRFYRDREPRSADGYVSPKEFQKEMGLTPAAYRKLRSEGKTPPELRLAENVLRISRAEMEAWKASRANEGRQAPPADQED
jgi:predicted DNA-binding transcriptional regulator AlpA